jgi:hypothetical protein
MSSEEKERFYDEKVAPVLLDLMQQCAERDMPFIAVVEWEPMNYGRTAHMPGEGVSAAMAITDLASRCEGNVDNLFMAIQRYGRKHGHNSIYLNMLESTGSADRGPVQ